MSLELSKAYTEVYDILKYIDKSYIDKIPKKFLSFIEKEKDNSYVPNINPDIALEEQNLLPDTINILAMLKLDYWCKDENEKNELITILKENEQKHQQDVYEKYNPDNIFKKKNEIKQEEKQIEKSLTVGIEEKWYQKIINKLRNFF